MGPGNTVYRATSLEPGNTVQFLNVGRTWVGVQYHAILSGFLKAGGAPDSVFTSNSNLTGKYFRDFQFAGYDNLCTAVVTDGTNYYVACRSMKTNGYYDAHIMKFDHSGTLVTAFVDALSSSIGGVVRTDIGGSSTKGHAFVRGMVYNSAASEIVITGAVGFYSPSYYHPFVARFNATTGAAKTDIVTGDTTSGSTAVTNVSSTTNLEVGRVVTGTGIPARTTITAISGATVTLSNAATATGTTVSLTAAHTILNGIQATNTITGDTSSGTNSILNASSTASVSPGQLITGKGIPADTVITAVVGSTLTISNNATATTAGTSLVVSKTIFGTATAIDFDSTNNFYYVASTDNPIVSAVTFTGTTATSSTSITSVSSTSSLYVGEAISGTGIPANATIASVTGTTVTISSAATANGTVTLTARPVHNFYVHKFATANLTLSAAPWGNPVDMVQAGGGTDSITTSIAVNGTQVLTVGSNRINSSTPPWNCTITAHVIATGNLDTSFGVVPISGGVGSKGISIFSQGGATPVNDCILNSVLKPATGTSIHMVGTVYNGSNYDPMAAKVTSAGALVGAFGTSGISSTSVMGSYDDVLNAYSYFGGTTYLYGVGRSNNATFSGGLTVKIDATTGAFAVSPSVTAISPSLGSALGGTPVTVTGTGFVNGSTSVSLGGVACGSLVFSSSTQVTCTTGAHAAGTVDAVVTVGTESGTLKNGFTYLPTITITSITPTAGTTAGGTPVTIVGTNFNFQTTVAIGGSSCTGLAIGSSTALTCSTPAHAAGAVNVVLTNPDATSATLTNGFTYVTPPTVTNVSASFGPIAGGATATITGTGFVDGATIKFGAITCGSVVFSSATTLTCVVPAGSPGPVAVSVTNPDLGVGSLGSGAYTYFAAPTVSTITPNGGPTAGGTAVVIRGTNFHSTATVAIGGVDCGTLTVNSTTQISCTTGAHASGAVDVVVTSVSQTGTLTSGFTYRAAPTVSSVNLSSGSVVGGASVTITGTGFVTGATATFGGSTCTSPNVSNATTMTCTTPSHAAGAVSVVVTNPDNQSGSATAYTFNNVTPTVTAISPTSGSTSGATAVTLTGTGFITGTTASVDGVNCSSVVVVSTTSLTCVTGAHAAGLVNVTATTSGGTGTLTNGYTYREAPSISFVTPNVGPVAGGTPVTITGVNFTGATSASFGASACTAFTAVSDTSITCTTPAGSGAVTVYVSATGLGTLSTGFTYRPAPTVTSVNASSGTVDGGVGVTVTGTGFITGATVTFGGSACTSPVVTSATTITCTTPTHAAGAVSVVVTNPEGQSGSATAYTFTNPVPTVTAIAPAGGAAAGGTPVTITGTGFISGATVAIGGVTCTSPTVVLPTRITCTTGAHGAGAVDVAVTTSGGTGTLTNGYTYQAAPAVTSVSPNGGPLAGGTVVTITGTNFTGGSGATFGGAACTAFTVVSNTSITCTTPAGSGAVNVVVTATGSGTLTNGYTFRAAPTVGSASPASGSPDGGYSVPDVTITGTGFIAGATVTIGGNACVYGSVSNSTTFVCSLIPSHAAGLVSIVITNPDGQSGSGNVFTYAYPTPTVTSITPTVGHSNGGTMVTIAGTGFVTGATVSIGGVTCTSPTVVSSTSMTCITGARAVGLVNVAVTTSGGTGTLTNGFTYRGTPVATSISPTGGALAGGTPVTVTGVNFTGVTSVEFVPSGGSFGQYVCTSLVVVSDTSITCTTPSGSGVVSVYALSPMGAGTATTYTYGAAPKVSSVAPTSGSVAGGTAVTITGTGFLTGATATFGGAACTNRTVVSATSLTCTTPSAAASGIVSVVVTNTDAQSGSKNAFTYFSPGDWFTTSTTSAPSGWMGHTAVWTGSRMLVWGGNTTYDVGSGNTPTNTGGLYSPVTDSWTSISTTNAASARAWHGAVWTGTKMVVWGGFNRTTDTYLNTGGIYDLATDTWTATSVGANVPAAKWTHWYGVPMKWTGSKVLIWGGYEMVGPGSMTLVNTGALFDPTTNQWSVMSTTGAPAARMYHTAVWTGSVMLIWGGYADTYLNTGGKYDPATNTWTAITTTGAPTARVYHVGIWANARLLIWGGQGSGTVLNDGKIYNPATDAWNAISSTNAPSARSGAIGLAVGARSFIWGGSDGVSGTFLNTGSIYAQATNTWTTVPVGSGLLGRTGASSAVYGAGWAIFWGGPRNYHSAGSTASTGDRIQPP